ncbi:hypothetical protein V6N11_034858 [Hibiscus sabdariffa]|uniref:Uncharacterized protein n=2 Tax=Hibiscus sabdariffa TaxID=183260 RepID=A0ABR2AIB5_9ROSI
MKETNAPSCFCGRPASLRTAWTDNNAGRRFYGCANHGHGFRRRSCNFFLGSFVALSIIDGALTEGAGARGAVVGGAGNGGAVAGGDKCGLPGGVRGALAIGVATSGVLCLILLLT